MTVRRPKTHRAARALVRGAILGLAMLLALPAANAASAARIELPSVFEAQIKRIKARTSIAVILPQKLPIDAGTGRVYASGGARPDGWSLTLDLAPRCGGASACELASFSAWRGERPHFRRRVGLRGGRSGYFSPAACGASCSPPAIEWLRGDVLYAIYADVGSERTVRRELIALANSAIARGPR